MILLRHAINARVGADGAFVGRSLLQKVSPTSTVQPGRESLAMSGAGQTCLHRYPSPLGRSCRSPGRPPRLFGGPRPAREKTPARDTRGALSRFAQAFGPAREIAPPSPCSRVRTRCRSDPCLPPRRLSRAQPAARRRADGGQWAQSVAPSTVCRSTTRLAVRQWAPRATSFVADGVRRAAEHGTARNDTITGTRPGPRGRTPAAALRRLKTGRPRPGTGEGSGCSRRS